MSTPNMSNMSFDSPIMVAKSFSTDADKETKDEDDAEKKLEEEKKAKKKDMFAPEADMFAEEYSSPSTAMEQKTLSERQSEFDGQLGRRRGLLSHVHWRDSRRPLQCLRLHRSGSLLQRHQSQRH